MRIFSFFTIVMLLVITGCSTYDSSKPRPHYYYAYNCTTKGACYDGASIRCKSVGPNKKPHNIQLKEVNELERNSGFLGGWRYRTKYEARFTCS